MYKIMALPREKKLWKLAVTVPRDEIFNAAEALIGHARDFFNWCDANPRYKTEIIKHKMEWDTVEVELKRPYTMSGVCMYLGVTQGYFRSTKSDLRERLETGTLSREGVEVLAAIEWIEQIVFTDQIEGAATGQYNANLMSRLNGLADNVNSTNVPDPILRIVTRDAETTSNLNLLTAGL